MLKKVVSLALALVLAIGVMSLNVFADDSVYPLSETPIDSFQPGGEVTVVDSGECGKNGGNVKWVLYSDGTVVISGSGEMKSFATSGKSVSPWYKMEGIKKVIVEPGITSVSNYAFYGCPDITEVSLPQGLERIGAGFIYGCEKLENIEIPSTVNNINNYAFTNCTSLTSVKIPLGVARIYDGTFNGCTNLKEVVITGGTTTIDANAFRGCENVVIYSYDGTYAKEFAEKKGIEFRYYVLHGDVNMDFLITAEDLPGILDHIKSIAPLDEHAADNADIYTDESIDIRDFNRLYNMLFSEQD